jgi:small subunit ribosomal protein S16
MALRIRLRQQGRHNRPFYRLVVTEARAPRDGKYIEMLGWYDPRGTTEETLVQLDSERVQHWINHGAEVSECALALVRRRAPEIVQALQEKAVAKRAKARAKRKARSA